MLGANTQANLLAGTGVLGYAVSTPYANGCPSPFGTPTFNGNVAFVGLCGSDTIAQLGLVIVLHG